MSRRHFVLLFTAILAAVVSSGPGYTSLRAQSSEPLPTVAVLATGRDHRRRGRVRRREGLHVRPARRRAIDQRRAAGEEARGAEGRADLQHRVAGHERRGVAEAGQPRQRAGRDGRRRRHRHHARHRHHRGDGVFSQPGGQDGQADRPDRLHAAGHGAFGRWPAELLQRGGRGREPGVRRTRGPGRAQRLDSRRRVAHEDQHDGRSDVHVPAVGAGRHRLLREGRVQSQLRSPSTRASRSSR